MIILATDSGLETTGYALFNKNESSFALINFDCILTKKGLLIQQRLFFIYQEFEKIISKNKPEIIVIERLFFNTNQKTLISIAQAQGALLILAAKYNIQVVFLTPLEIKQTLTGYGRADKIQVRKMVKILLNQEKIPKQDDIVDAIACGLAYCSIKNLKL